MVDDTAATASTTSNDKKEDKKPKVAFPERATDGCTHCGMLLSIYDKAGNLDVAASEAAQRDHGANIGCVATPTFSSPQLERKIDKKSGKLEGEYAPAFGK